MTRLEREEIRQALGILLTNTLSISIEEGQEIMGLFPKYAMLNHSCQHNTVTLTNIPGVTTSLGQEFSKKSLKGLCHMVSGDIFLCLSGCVWVSLTRLGGLIKWSHMVPMDPQRFWFLRKKTRENSNFWFFCAQKCPFLGPYLAQMDQILTQEQWEYKKSFRSLVQDVLRYFGIMIFSKNGP